MIVITKVNLFSILMNRTLKCKEWGHKALTLSNLLLLFGYGVTSVHCPQSQVDFQV